MSKKFKKKLPPWLTGLPKHEIKETQTSHDLAPACPFENDMIELKFDGKIVYSTNKEDCDLLCDDLIYWCEQTSRVIGFDMEWPVTYIKGRESKTALIQMCTGEDQCYLFHLSAIGEFPEMLKRILMHDNVTFVGVGIESDLWKLERNFDISVFPIVKNHAVDLSKLANDVLKSSERFSLDNLTKHLFKVKLNKDAIVRTGDWDKWPLTEQQQIYAATDAFVSLKIYTELQMRLKRL